MSPAGFWSSSYVWNVRSTGDMNKNYTGDTNTLRPAINLKTDARISLGDGTKENPFVVE